MRRRPGFTYTELLCVMAIIAVVWALLLPAMARARSRADETTCAQRLRSISLALRLYADDHFGWLPPEPPGLRALCPRYLYDDEVFRCPTTLVWEKRWARDIRPAPPGTVDYTYRPGLAIDDRPQEAVAWDNAARHRGRSNVLYLSGRVRGVAPSALPALSPTAPARPEDLP